MTIFQNSIHDNVFNKTGNKQDSLFYPGGALLFCWIIVISYINPAGEFMINDDWSYTLIVEALLNGTEINTTGWGGGGPSCFSHISWGLLWSLVFGFSPTILRMSVLFLAVSASFALLVLVKKMGISKWIAFCASLTMVFNPLFLSQSFTFMTDITFAAHITFSFLFLHKGIEKGNQTCLFIGLVFALLATVTRQLGVVIPIGFVITLSLHPQGRQLPKLRFLIVTVCVSLVPWLLYEVFLWAAGSTPVTSHPVFQRIFLYPKTKGIPDYLFFLITQAGIICLYSCFLVSPLLVLGYENLRKNRLFIKMTGLLTIVFALFEISLFSRLIDPPVGFYKNIIFNFGIGPVLLKDIYLLGINRTMTLPKPVFYFLVYLSLLSVAGFCFMAVRSLPQLMRGYQQKTHGMAVRFTSCFALICALIYSAVILLTGFHDRYLIPVCIFLIIWCSGQPDYKSLTFRGGASLCSAFLLLVIGGTSVLNTRDFLSLKRSQHEAHTFVIEQLKADPCDIDGGFEFNGYYCSGQARPREKENYSWWWVNSENYLISLGPLPGYKVIKKFPFERMIGDDGAIHILKADTE